MYYFTTTSTLDINLETATANSTSTPTLPTPTTSTQTPQSRSRRLTTAARIAALEQLIRDNQDDPHLRRIDMAHILGVGLSRIKDDLRLLAAQDKVVFVGSGSHSGHWHIVGDPETEVEVEQWLQTPGYHLLHGSRGRYVGTDNPTSTRRKSVSTPKMAPSEKAKAVAHTVLNCLAAAYITPESVYRGIYRKQYTTAPYYETRDLWREAVAPLRPLLRRG